MSVVKTFFSKVENKVFYILSKTGVFNGLDDESYIRLVWRRHFRTKLNLAEPRTFNEKLQWLKLNDRRPIYTTLVDKYEVKSYVADIIGEKYVIPTLGVWDTFDEIDFSILPEQFVLKCTHDSGSVIVCKDKNKFDYKNAKHIIDGGLSKNYYYRGREWPYKEVKPRVIAEPYMQDQVCGELRDYKFYCFNGVPRMMFVATGRASKRLCFDFFDMEYNHLPIKQCRPNAPVLPEKPETFDRMVEFSKVLSMGLPHIRVDFYEMNHQLYFGELTLYDSSGFGPFEPDRWDAILGEYIELPADIVMNDAAGE